MLRPVAALVAARTRRRGAATALSIAAVAAATALVAIVAGIGLVASDATLARALAATGADRPTVSVSEFASSDRGADEIASQAATALAGLEAFTQPVVRGVLVHELRDVAAPVFELVVGVDDPAALTILSEGRMPAPCLDGARCEAVLLALDPPDFAFDVARPSADLELTIVGRGQLDAAVPFGDLDQRGPFGSEPGGGQYQTERASPAVLLVNGVDAIAHSPALDGTGRTYIWTAPLDVSAVHPWSAAALRQAVTAVTVALTQADSGFSLASPVPLVDAELRRAEAARGRLLLIGSLGVAILLAFAVFLALVVRDDLAAEVARLSAIGARRRERVTFLILEAAVPALAGGIVGWTSGAVVVGGLAAWSGVDAWAVMAGTVAAPGSLVALAGVLVAAIAAVAAATAPGLPRGGSLRLAGAVAGTACLILGWQLAAGGSLGAAGLAQSLVSPIVVILPPVLAFVVALAFVTALPPLLRALARRARRAPLPVRLSLLSVSREPARPAATLTLLAFSLGAIVFAVGWSASLRQGIDDAAAYRSGLDLRVSELGTGLSISRSVVPVERYGALGDDLTMVPVYRDSAPNQPGGRVDIVGLPAAALPTLPGWRADFSSTSVADLAARLSVPAPAGGWTLAGHRLDADAGDLVLPIRYDGARLRLDAVIATTGGDTAIIAMGDVDASMTKVAAALPDGTRGGLLTALIFRNPGLVAGSGHQDELRRATVAFLGLDGLVDESPRDLEIFTTSVEIIRAAQVTDGLRLPAVVSPDLAATATAEGDLALQVGNDMAIPLRVVGVATRMPTVVDERPRFVTVPLEPFLVALTSAVPGAGRPTEMWIAAADAGRVADVRASLAQSPFRFATVTARADLAAMRAGDPLSQAIVWTLVVTALAGLVLSVGGLILGTVTDLRDDRGELADLEAQGITPSDLRWHALARTAWLAFGGAAAGIVVGLVLTVLITAALALTAEGTTPIPPLAVVIPIVPILAVVLAVLAVVLGSAGWLARRAYSRATLGERRAGQVTNGPDVTLRPSSEQADG
ncbi:MAG: FtsX-like permease family protein [Candidatus Limnocylindrales bacterium]